MVGPISPHACMHLVSVLFSLFPFLLNHACRATRDVKGCPSAPRPRFGTKYLTHHRDHLRGCDDLSLRRVPRPTLTLVQNSIWLSMPPVGHDCGILKSNLLGASKTPGHSRPNRVLDQGECWPRNPSTCTIVELYVI